MYRTHENVQLVFLQNCSFDHIDQIEVLNIMARELSDPFQGRTTLIEEFLMALGNGHYTHRVH